MSIHTSSLFFIIIPGVSHSLLAHLHLCTRSHTQSSDAGDFWQLNAFGECRLSSALKLKEIIRGNEALRWKRRNNRAEWKDDFKEPHLNRFHNLFYLCYKTHFRVEQCIQREKCRTDDVSIRWDFIGWCSLWWIFVYLYFFQFLSAGDRHLETKCQVHSSEHLHVWQW